MRYDPFNTAVEKVVHVSKIILFVDKVPTKVHLETNKMVFMSCYSMVVYLNPTFKIGNKQF